MAELSSDVFTEPATEDTDVDVDEFTGSFFGELMKNISTCGQVERLAHNLNLKDSEIHRIHNDDPVLFGIRVLKAWKNDHPHNTPSDARQELTIKLEQSGLHQQAKRVQHLRLKAGQPPVSPVPSLRIKKQGAANYMPLLQSPPPEDNDGEEQQQREQTDEPPRHCCTRKCVFCYAVMIIPIILLGVSAIVVLYEVPAVNNNVQPVYVKNNDAVELIFNVDYIWLERVTLAIDHVCSGSLFIVQGKTCGEVQTLKASDMNVNSQEPVYLVSGSQIFINFPSRTQSEVNIWIVRGGFEALNDYKNHACNDPPFNMVCLAVDHHSGVYTYSVTETSYYFVTIDPHVLPPGLSWNFSVVKYNYAQLLSSRVGKLHDDTPATFMPEKPSVFNYNQMCILLHVDEDSCIAPSYGKLTVKNILKRHDILVIPGLVMCVLLLIPCFIAVMHFVYYKRSTFRSAGIVN